jgi:phosphoglycolate phosphatase-like HAD superfamily hydrolase
MISSSPTCVVLLDIDGTLVTGPDNGPSAGLLAMNRAAYLVTKSDLFGNPSEFADLTDMEIASRFRLGDPSTFAGRTDVQIARQLLVLAGFDPPRENLVKELVDTYVDGLAGFAVDIGYTALGDPHLAVPRLNEIGAIVGLGTGNVPPGARIKLQSAGIDHLFDPALGGYGDDGETRADLLRIGARRCDPGGNLPVIIVGDTPRDILAAHEIGAICVGVPYRHNTDSVLTKAGADIIADSVGSDLVGFVNDRFS